MPNTAVLTCLGDSSVRRDPNRQTFSSPVDIARQHSKAREVGGSVATQEESKKYAVSSQRRKVHIMEYPIEVRAPESGVGSSTHNNLKK